MNYFKVCFLINIISPVFYPCQHFFPDVGTDTMEIVHLMLQTLIEMCVANIDNQQVIYNSQVIMDVLNAILQIQLHYKVGDEYQRYKHYELKRVSGCALVHVCILQV